MIRFLLLVLLVFALPVFSAGHTVTAVLPVKFNSIGPYPAPVPYSQKLMNGGRIYVPTLTNAQKSEIFLRNLNRKTGFQPQVITKKSLAKTLGQMGKNASRLHPAIKAAALMAGAYEANCESQLFTSLCVSTGGPQNETQVDINTPHKRAKMEDTVSCNANFNGQMIGVFKGSTFGECYNSAATSISSKIVLPKGSETIELSPTQRLTVNRSFTPHPCDFSGTSCPVGVKITEVSTTSNCAGDANGNQNCTTSEPSIYVYNVGGSVDQASKQVLPKCPPDDGPSFKFGPFKPDGAREWRCYQGLSEGLLAEDFFESALADDPEILDGIISSPDIGLDDFVDQQTGQPYDSLFPEKRFDDVSEKFANAAKAITTRTAQTSDPSNTETYIPPDVYNITVTNVNQWFEGNTFTDTFTQQHITPDNGEPSEGIPTDWTDFPGLTQKQYDSSNERVGTNAMQQIQSIDNAETDEQVAFDRFKDFANTHPKDPDFFTLADYIDLPTSGSCVGFSIDASLSAQPVHIFVDQHCPPYDAWGRPLVEWFLGVLTIIQLFRIFQRTLEVA